MMKTIDELRDQAYALCERLTMLVEQRLVIEIEELTLDEDGSDRIYFTVVARVLADLCMNITFAGKNVLDGARIVDTAICDSLNQAMARADEIRRKMITGGLTSIGANASHSYADLIDATALLLGDESPERIRIPALDEAVSALRKNPNYKVLLEATDMGDKAIIISDAKESAFRFLWILGDGSILSNTLFPSLERAWAAYVEQYEIDHDLAPLVRVRRGAAAHVSSQTHEPYALITTADGRVMRLNLNGAHQRRSATRGELRKLFASFCGMPVSVNFSDEAVDGVIATEASPSCDRPAELEPLDAFAAGLRKAGIDATVHPELSGVSHIQIRRPGCIIVMSIEYGVGLYASEEAMDNGDSLVSIGWS